MTEPRRRTALASVVHVRGDAFALDRSLYCPKSHAYRHPQVADRGTVWTPGRDKRNLASVFEDQGTLWHRLEGFTPPVGMRLQCHLDVERREETERAHTALHLLLHTIPPNAGALAEDPEVRGGGHIRIELDAPFVAPDLLARWRAAALGEVQTDRMLARAHVVDTATGHSLRPQPFADGTRFPGPATTREAVQIHGLGAFPCDGTHTERTGAVGDVVLQQAQRAKHGGTTLVWRIR